MSEEYTTGTGQTIHNVHSADQCRGRNCVIHNPSDHEYKDWPTNWGYLSCMERIRPEDGKAFIDPDELAYHYRTNELWAACIEAHYQKPYRLECNLMMDSITCPYCKANLIAGEIPPEQRESYSGDYFYRTIGIYDYGKDMTLAYRCPDCGAQDPRQL